MHPCASQMSRYTLGGRGAVRGVLFFVIGLALPVLHVTAYVNNQETCHSPLGLAYDATERIVDFELTSSDGIANNVRLNGPESWTVNSLANNPFVQVTFSMPMLVTGILTQGAEGGWVVQFRVAYSRDCEAYSTGQVYSANLSNETTMTHLFHNLTLAKCVRIFPTEFDGTFAAMRLELLGCDFKQCTNQLRVFSSDMLEPELGDHPGVVLKMTSEVILTSLALTYEAPAHEDVQIELEYSRSCVEYTAVENGQMTQLYRSPEYMQRQVSRVAFYTPVRAQCLRVRPVAHTLLEEVRAYGCDTSLAEGTFEECGHTRKTSGTRRKRVVGGSPVTPGDWPWLVSMHFLQWHNFTNSSGLKHLCGASLINRQWVLSAAHCFDPNVWAGLDEPSNWRVALGEHDQSSVDGTEQLVEVETIIRHPMFTLNESMPILYDIALVKLKTPAVLSDYVNVICLDELGGFPPGTKCLVSGWGQDTMATPGTKLPFSTFLPIIDQDTCRDKYHSLPENHTARSVVRIDDSVFCAASETGGKDACFGDSGGPFVCQQDDRWFQVGIVSIGYICADNQYPGIYTRVSHFKDWIYNTIDAN